ncbi:hypothetical protein RchiOBHm_Chr4g0406751 [Rosa chinensis]|uniref:Uncharacterized protein n=1 Tax=Rosa chinensis TaxID=74649 RepID=A0A2P6QUD8_ROSCH|nr:hypothetical protein RchiOBHm_Chr4g0406751 [Rosa chinensis]
MKKDVRVTSNFSFPDSVVVLQWIPLTTVAVALRLMEFDICGHRKHATEEAGDSEEQGI